MSKLYEQYKNLKKVDKNKIYIFKSGIFYIALEEDATELSNIFGFKIVNLNNTLVKCGFPQNRISHYCNLLINKNISFQIVDSNYTRDR